MIKSTQCTKKWRAGIWKPHLWCAGLGLCLLALEEARVAEPVRSPSPSPRPPHEVLELVAVGEDVERLDVVRAFNGGPERENA